MCTELVLPHLGQAARVDDGRVPDLPHEVGEVGGQQHHVGALLEQCELLQPLEVEIDVLAGRVQGVHGALLEDVRGQPTHPVAKVNSFSLLK